MNTQTLREKLINKVENWDLRREAKAKDLADAILALFTSVAGKDSPKWKQSVGMLRQWLNERPNPKELITNEQIEIWFADYHTALVEKIEEGKV